MSTNEDHISPQFSGCTKSKQEISRPKSKKQKKSIVPEKIPAWSWTLPGCLSRPPRRPRWCRPRLTRRRTRTSSFGAWDSSDSSKGSQKMPLPAEGMSAMPGRGWRPHQSLERYSQVSHGQKRLFVVLGSQPLSYLRLSGVPNGVMMLDVAYLESLDQVDKHTRMKVCEEVKGITVQLPSSPSHLVRLCLFCSCFITHFQRFRPWAQMSWLSALLWSCKASHTFTFLTPEDWPRDKTSRSHRYWSALLLYAESD